MGASTIYPCGCSFTRSMFGKREIEKFNICQEHTSFAYTKTIEEFEQIIIDLHNKREELRGRDEISS
jgi:hypothetical protein